MDRIYVNTTVFNENVTLEIKVPMEWDDEERNINVKIENDKVVNKPTSEIYNFFHSHTCYCNYNNVEMYSESTDDEDYNYNNTDNYDPNRVVYEYWKDNNECLPNANNLESSEYLVDYAESSEYVMNEELLETNAMYL